MNTLLTIIKDRDRPVIVTIIAVIGTVAAALKLFRFLSIVAKYPSLFSVPLLAVPVLFITLAYFLLKGANWARITFAFLYILSALLLTIAMNNNHFTASGVAAIAYMLFVFGTLTMNQKVVAYFRKHKGVQQSGPAYPPQGVGSADP